MKGHRDSTVNGAHSLCWALGWGSKLSRFMTGCPCSHFADENAEAQGARCPTGIGMDETTQ